MIQFAKRCSIVIGCFTLVAFNCDLVDAQSGERPLRLLQSAADIASLPASKANPAQVRVGFAPAQSNTSSGYQGSFSQQPNSDDVYPYPASSNPAGGVGSQSAYALSQGSGGGQLTNQVSLGSGTSTGNLNGFSNAGSSNRNSSNVDPRLVANSRAPVEQQRASTLSPAAQARINQAAVDRLRAQQTANSSSAASANRPPADRTASQANLYGQSESNTAFRQSAVSSGSANRNTASARVAQGSQGYCCQPGFTPVSAGFQGAAFQAPAINPNVGAGLGLGIPPNLQNQAGFNQQQCCQPQAGLGATGFQGFQGNGLQQGFQGAGFQGGQFGGGLGVPQFGAQGARWWTPFVRGTGVYTPLLDLTPNNNAGTYLGQGIIGQPTAYVHGQLLRNLLRYLAP